MDRHEFESLVSDIHYKAGWRFWVSRSPSIGFAPFDSSMFYPPNEVDVVAHIVVQDSSREYAPTYPLTLETDVSLTCPVHAFHDQTDAYRFLMHELIEFETHEAREFFRIGPHYNAPFHPHTTEGIDNFNQSHLRAFHGGMTPYAFEHLVSKVRYRPGWQFTFEANTLRINAKVKNSDPRYFPNYQEDAMTASVSVVIPEMFANELNAYRLILNTIIGVETHEAREFFKVGKALRAPFHPHTQEGIANFH